MIGDEGEQIGVMPPFEALKLARSKNLDLVEISPTAQPPVCRIMDYGKYLYQQEKKEREAKKHQKTITVKEVKFRINVDDHDYETKKNHVLRFLDGGDKVKATIFFRGREMTRTGLGPQDSGAADQGRGTAEHRGVPAAAGRQHAARDIWRRRNRRRSGKRKERREAKRKRRQKDRKRCCRKSWRKNKLAPEKKTSSQRGSGRGVHAPNWFAG